MSSPVKRLAVLSKATRGKEFLDSNGDIDPLKLNLVARMGGNYYLDIKPENLFEIKKPVGVNAIGVDNLPNHINDSDILSKNDIARLGNVEMIPKKLHFLVNQLAPDLQEII